MWSARAVSAPARAQGDEDAIERGGRKAECPWSARDRVFGVFAPAQGRSRARHVECTEGTTRRRTAPSSVRAPLPRRRTRKGAPPMSGTLDALKKGDLDSAPKGLGAAETDFGQSQDFARREAEATSGPADGERTSSRSAETLGRAAVTAQACRRVSALAPTEAWSMRPQSSDAPSAPAHASRCRARCHPSGPGRRAPPPTCPRLRARDRAPARAPPATRDPGG